MTIRFLRTAFLAAAITAVSSAASSASTDTWTNVFDVAAGAGPYWINFAGYGGNWSLNAVPTATDDVVFQLPVVPASASFNTGTPPFQPLADGRTIVLFPSSTFPPPLVANSLTFLGSYHLVTAAAAFNPYGIGPYKVEALTLSSGRISVGFGVTATIDVPLASSTGTLTKIGPGTLLLNDAPGGFAAGLGNMLVQQGVLGGNFTVTGNLTNLAVLSPGNSPGTVRVGGNYIQGKSGTLSIQLASPTSFDQLLVGGQAQLHGTLAVSYLNGFKVQRGQQFDIIHADGGISGRFDETGDSMATGTILTLGPVYHSNDVILRIVQGSFAALAGLTANEQSVARSLDRLASDDRASRLIDHLDGEQLNRLPGEFDRIAPEELTSIFAISMASAQMQSLNLQRRTDDLRSGSSGFSAAGLAINGSGPSYSGGFGITTGVAGPNGNADDGKESKEMKTVAPVENRWGAFLSGTGEWVSVGSTDNARGYDLSSGGFTLGVDYKVTPHFAVGIAAGYIGTTADLTDHGRVWVNGGKLGLYATTFAGGWYADVAAFGGYNSYDTRRAGIEGDTRGNTDGGEVNALFGTGYDFKKGGLTFGPTATFNYAYVGMNGFTENGSIAPLDIHGSGAESLRTAFGFKISYDCKCGGVVIKPELRAAWQHEYGDAVYDLSSSFANGGGGTFTTAGPQVGRDSALLGAGFAVQFTERTSAYLYYDGELGRTNYQSTAVTGGLRVAF